MSKLRQIESAFSSLKGSYEHLETSVRAMLGILEGEPRNYPPIVATYEGEKDWGWGLARTTVRVYETHPGDPRMCDVNMIWIGESEQPDQVTYYWYHLWEYLAAELPEYLSKYSIAPTELLCTLKSSLPVSLRAYFKDETPELPEP